MNEKNNNITSKQLMIFLITAQIGTGTLTLSSTLAKEVGHDGWISVALAWLISMIVLVLIMKLLKRYSNKSIIEINKLIFGKYLGTLFNLIMLFYLVSSTIVLIREIIEVVHIIILKLTPGIVLTCLMIIPTAYICWYGIKCFCRFSSEIIFTTFIIIIIFALTSKEFRINFVKPIGYAGIIPITKGIFPSIFSFLGIELIAIFYPNIIDKDKALKYALFGNALTGFFFTTIVFITTGIFGENLIKHLVFPLLNIPRIVKLPFLERVDILFIILWLPIMGGSSRAFFLSAFHTIRKIFKIQKMGVPYAFFICVVILLSRIPRDLNAILNYETKVNLFGIIINLYLVLCYMLSFIFKRGIEGK